MFGYSDKISLSVINALDKDGNIIDFQLSFPISEDFEIPDNILQVSIFEMRQDIGYQGFNSFKIFIGTCSSIDEMYEAGILDKTVIRENLHIKRLDKKICYFDNEKGNHVIYTTVDRGDIVVKNKDEMKNVLINISNEFASIKSSIARIKKMGE